MIHARQKIRAKQWDGVQSANQYVEEFNALFNRMKITDDRERIAYIMESLPAHPEIYRHLVSSRPTTVQELKESFIELTEFPDKFLGNLRAKPEFFGKQTR